MERGHAGQRVLAPKPSISDSSASKIQRKGTLLRSQEPHDPTFEKPKRGQVKAACVACQRGKAKVRGLAHASERRWNFCYLHVAQLILQAQCDGIRPACTRCTSKAVACVYDVEIGVSRSQSMRRKNDGLQAEVDRLRELLAHGHNVTKTKSLENCQQLREPGNLKDIATIPEDSNTSSQQCATVIRDETLAFDLENLDVAALSKSTFQVHARPWTALANDGLVSELISSFFASEGCFYLSFVDQQHFLDDMEAGDIEMAEFCSPLLVNAICALRCVSEHRRALDDVLNTVFSRPPATLERLAPCRASMPPIAFSRRPGIC